MKKRYKLGDLFQEGEELDYSHKDYLLQVIANGQPSALREHVKEIQTNSLLIFLDITEMTETYRNIIREEIVSREAK